jgi:hypothetical protein
MGSVAAPLPSLLRVRIQQLQAVSKPPRASLQASPHWPLTWLRFPHWLAAPLLALRLWGQLLLWPLCWVQRGQFFLGLTRSKTASLSSAPPPASWTIRHLGDDLR